MKLSIIIPVFNEKNNIKTILEAVKKADTNQFEKEIIVVDDYSTDGSREILAQDTDITLILAEKNKGKGAAIKLGLPCVTGDFILFQDADMEYSPDNYKDLLHKVSNETVVFGSRYLQKNKRNHLSSGAQMVNYLFNILFATKITDVATCYKIFPASLQKDLLKIKDNDFVFDVIQASIVPIKKGLMIEEVPIVYNPRTYKEGKKLKIKHGIRIAVITILEGIKYRLMHKM
ncbi:MAG: hypothetical protein RLZZ308_151 [Candidatus Parcubacteria bacterium]|jgi:glycosyltransferase involved in cell wall biosynthesis